MLRGEKYPDGYVERQKRTDIPAHRRGGNQKPEEAIMYPHDARMDPHQAFKTAKL